MFYQDPHHAIEAIKVTVAQYPSINALISRHDFSKWQKRLNKSIDFEKELTEAETFNILNLLSTVHIEQRFPELDRVGTPVIINLERWLEAFPQLLRDDIFTGKIKNLDRDSFLSTLSELLVAAQLHQLGYGVKFEHKFTIPATDGNRDIDLTITTPANEFIHIEIYSPYMPAHDGFFNFNDEDEPFSKKVAFKMDDKFGAGQVQGLNGKVLMAVDTRKVEGFDIRKAFTGQNNDNLYASMKPYLAAAAGSTRKNSGTAFAICHTGNEKP